jgi:hypothetical protein
MRERAESSSGTSVENDALHTTEIRG